MAAEEYIRRIASMKSGILVGAGTVLSINQAEQAVSAGASFIVSPGFNPLVVDWCLEKRITVIPGIATPSEVLQAMNRGLSILKFFPAEALGGIPYLEAMTPAFPDIRFVPTGGISAANMAAWLKLSCVHAVAGSWIVHPRMLAEEALGEVTCLAAEAVAKLTRRPGVAALTAGPGVTNGVSGITSAYFNAAPVLVLGGRAPAFRWGSGSLQEIDHVPIVAPITKHASTVGGLDEIPGAAQRPVIIAGSDVYASDAVAELRAAAEALGVPVFTNGMGRGALPPEHPLAFAKSRRAALSDAFGD